MCFCIFVAHGSQRAKALLRTHPYQSVLLCLPSIAPSGAEEGPHPVHCTMCPASQQYPCPKHKKKPGLSTGLSSLVQHMPPINSGMLQQIHWSGLVEVTVGVRIHVGGTTVFLVVPVGAGETGDVAVVEHHVAIFAVVRGAATVGLGDAGAVDYIIYSYSLEKSQYIIPLKSPFVK